jgi:catechol 2,3-dioxygenase-like lactoylglutathione lyase family enzyme
MTPASGVGTTDPDTPTRIAFFQLPGGFPYTQRIAVFECADVSGAQRYSVGLHHLQVRYPELERLYDQYLHLKALGVRPVEASNHGVASSLYYRDPDGDKVELSGMNFATEEEMREFMQSEDFQSNPDGHEIDPEEYFAPGGARRRATAASVGDCDRGVQIGSPVTFFARTAQGVARLEGEDLCLLDLAASLDELIAGISRYVTLEPADLIITVTPRVSPRTPASS